MRVYLVIVDESDEARVALRFATRRAIKTQGQVHILALVPPQPFSAFGSIQATIEEEARARAETIAAAAAGSVLSQAGHMPVIAVVAGDPVKTVREYLSQHSEVAALVLGAPAAGASGAGQGPLIGHFTGTGLGALSCPLFIVPGGMDEAEIDRLS
jgi:nucleotide-binding universal stress UspA family protein